jgi:hypothetical protein
MSKKEYVEFFEKVWSKNKAMGLAAQAHFENEMNGGTFKKHIEKLFHGCWLISPKALDSHKFRFCIFVHGKLLKISQDEMLPKSFLGEKSRPFYAVAEYMNNAGIGVVYAIPFTDSGKFDFDAMGEKDYTSLKWDLFFYENEKFVKKNASEFFDKWEGSGHPTYRKERWDNDSLKEAFNSMEEEKLESMLLNELFYTGYLKSIVKKPTNDPYDVDGFIISLSQKHILPIEIKEKFPVLTKRERYFGIDAGRIMMLLRLCIPNDSNAIYIIRQVTENGRKLEAWKFITLSKIIMSAGWNLQAGGRGMGGQDTQTVKLPYDEFENITEKTFEEENLKQISDLPKEVKELVVSYKKDLQKKFF